MVREIEVIAKIKFVFGDLPDILPSSVQGGTIMARKKQVRFPYDPALFYMMPNSTFFSEEKDGGVVIGHCTVEDCFNLGCMPFECKFRAEVERWLGFSLEDLNILA